MSACNCCEAFPINVVTLQGRSKSASLSKCGFSECVSNTFSGGNFGGGTPDGSEDWSYSLGNCADDYQEGDPLPPSTIYLYRTITLLQERGIGDPPATLTQTETFTFNPETGECDATVTRSGIATDDIFVEGVGVDLSSEYTNGQLIANTLTQLPEEYGEWQNNTPSAQNLLFDFYSTEDDAPFASYATTESEVRIVHPPTATGYLRVWMVRRDYEWDDENSVWANPTESAFATYTWSGEPPSDAHGINEEENRISSESYELVSEGNAQLSKVYVSKWSLIEGYEPSDPLITDAGNANFTVSRPTSDCESNGVPTLNEDCSFRP